MLLLSRGLRLIFIRRDVCFRRAREKAAPADLPMRACAMR
jgi:hypothetical protein